MIYGMDSLFVFPMPNACELNSWAANVVNAGIQTLLISGYTLLILGFFVNWFIDFL